MRRVRLINHPEQMHGATTTSLGTILSIWAHPDDETYLAGGLMAAAADHGQRVVCVSATAGEHGTDDPDRWPPERLGRVRQLEAVAAMAVLGVREHRILGLPDGALDACHEEGVSMIGRLLDEIEPDTVLTFGPDGMTFHPDHIAVHRWVTGAWHERGCRARLLYATVTTSLLARFGPLFEEWGVYMTAERPTGAAVEDLALLVQLEGQELDRKLTALRAMATQTSGALASIDPDDFAAQAAEEAFVEASAGSNGPRSRER
jgi:LmbE family N-acetylglucosaminyl deacetylase